VWWVFASLHEGGASRESRRIAGFPVRFHTHIVRGNWHVSIPSGGNFFPSGAVFLEANPTSEQSSRSKPLGADTGRKVEAQQALVENAEMPFGNASFRQQSTPWPAARRLKKGHSSTRILFNSRKRERNSFSLKSVPTLPPNLSFLPS
jgi:hypothetical protein